MDPVQSLTALSDKVSPALYAFGVAAILAEAIYLAVKEVPRDRRSRVLGIQCGVLAFGAEGLLHATVLFAAQLWVYEHRVFDLGFSGWVFVLCWVVNDLMFYASHRLMHRCRCLWAVHVVHHSPKHYDLTTGVRGSVLGGLASAPFYVWIPLLGIHPIVFLIVDKLFKFYGLAYHTEFVRRLGPLEHLLVTPSSHRVHHAVNPQYIDKNYGGFFILFDKLFGTFTPEDEAPVYGLVKDWHGYGLVDCQVHELRDLWRDVRAARGLDKLRYLVKPPGWSPAPAAELNPARR